mgnify:CR=1 FL=1
MERKDPNDPIVRTVLWKGYDKKCFYGKELIRFNNFELDHVIPQSMDVKDAIETYDLLEDFELDSYYNLVPTCHPCNNRKRAKEFSEETIRYYMELIRDKVEKIENIEKDRRRADPEDEFRNRLDIALEDKGFGDILTIMEQYTSTELQQKAIRNALKEIQPISTLSMEENEKLQVFIDKINYYIEEFSILKSFNNKIPSKFHNKKIGIIIYREDSDSLAYSLFELEKGSQPKIKEVPKDSWESLVSQGIVESKTIDMHKDLLRNPEAKAKEIVFDYYAELLSKNIFFKSTNEYLANEYIFDFITENKMFLGLEIKEIYSKDEIEFAFKRYFPLFMEESLKLIDSDFIENLLSRSGYINLDSIKGTINAMIERIREKVEKRLRNENFNLKNNYPINSKKFPLGVVDHFLTVIKDNDINNIGRIYNLPDFAREEFQKDSYVYNAYSDKDVVENFKLIYNNLKQVYNHSVRNVLPWFKEQLIPLADTPILIQLLKRNGLYSVSPYLIKTLYLDSEEGEKFRFIIQNYLDNNIDTLDFQKNITVNGKNYHVIGGSGKVEDELFEILPMLNKAKGFLKKNIRKLLDEDYKEFLLTMEKNS